MRNRNAEAYLLLLPSIVLAVLFSFYPLIKSVVLSFFTVSQQGVIHGFAGLDNYISLFSDKAFINSIGHTLLFMVMFLPMNILLIMAAAVLTRRGNRSTAVAEYVFLIPMAVSLSSLSLIFREIFRGEISIINRILGTHIRWLESPLSAMFTLALLGVFLDFGIDYILMLSSFRRIDRTVIEAAELDGAGQARIFLSIELPEVRPMLSVVFFLSVKDALMISAPVMILTAGGPFRSTETIMYYYYLEAFRSGNRGAETAISSIMVLVAGLLMLLFSSKRKYDV